MLRPGIVRRIEAKIPAPLRWLAAPLHVLRYALYRPVRSYLAATAATGALLNVAPGMTSRSHRHNGHEQFLILEGELHESDGRVLKAGDLVFYRDGSEHNSYTPNGCLLAVHIAGPEFHVD
jgi:quercetin dioxygenase-like cupin family protein